MDARVDMRVSYEDMANPRREGTIIQRVGDEFRICWDDGTWSISDCRQNGWREVLSSPSVGTRAPFVSCSCYEEGGERVECQFCYAAREAEARTSDASPPPWPNAKSNPPAWFVELVSSGFALLNVAENAPDDRQFLAPSAQRLNEALAMIPQPWSDWGHAPPTDTHGMPCTKEASPIRPVGLHPFEAGEGGDPRTEDCMHHPLARCGLCSNDASTSGDGSSEVIEVARTVRDSLRPGLTDDERRSAWTALDDALLEYDRRARRAAQRH